VKLEDRLKQIEKRIAELQRKAESIRAELKPNIVQNIVQESVQKPVIPAAVVEAVEESEQTLVEQPRRRGRRKLNETE
jgi:hypothetical protein